MSICMNIGDALNLKERKKERKKVFLGFRVFMTPCIRV
jgi:hypothetical protein